MIYLVTDETGQIHQSIDADLETAKLYLEPGQSLAVGCSVQQLNNGDLCIRDGVIARRLDGNDLFDWGVSDDLPGEGEPVELVYTAPTTN